jgi:hypothetical protein
MAMGVLQMSSAMPGAALTSLSRLQLAAAGRVRQGAAGMFAARPGRGDAGGAGVFR